MNLENVQINKINASLDIFTARKWKGNKQPSMTEEDVI